MTGLGTPDHQTKIMNTLRASQAASHDNINDFMRQSIKSLKASEGQSLNESMVIGALAEYYMNGSLQKGGLDKSIGVES